MPTNDAATSHSTFSRFFRNPATGELVLVQRPNLPLWIFLLATVARVVFHPKGAVGTGVSVVGTVSLVVWSIMEIVRGDSPFRRVLGAVVLTVVVVSFVMNVTG